MNNKYDKRVYAGYYKRYDGKLFYVVTMAKDGVTDEDMVIYMPYSIRETDYLTISKKQFCEPVMVDGKLRARYKRQTQMRIEQDFIEVLEMDNLPSPKRKPVPIPDEEKHREYRVATNYYDYAKDLCVNYLVDFYDRRKARSSGNERKTKMKILTLPTAESGINFRVLPIITNGRSGEKMLDKNKLQNCRAASVSTCDVSELKDIRKIEIASAQPRANRAIGFLNQVGNPYLFKVGETVVKVEYEGERGFSEAFADLLCAS